MPPKLLGLVLHVTGKHQIWISILSILLFIADTVPIEAQRRLVNAAVKGGNFTVVFWLAVAFAVLTLLQGFI